MPAMKGKSSFDINKALKAYAKTPVEYRQEFINLPGDITGGIAKLVEAKLGEYKQGPNKGEKFLYLAGVVISPKTATDVKKIWEASSNGKPGSGSVRVVSAKEVNIEGQRTGQTLPLCETKRKDGTVTSADDNVKRALNELKLLGGEECTSEISSEADLESLCETLKEQGIYFKFSTSSQDPTKDYPNPRVWENWYGTKGLEDYSPVDSDDVVDNTPPGDSETQAPDEPPADPAGESDVAELVEAADGGDSEAQDSLKQLAIAAGASEEQVDAAVNWTEVAEMITAAAEQPAEPEPQEWKVKDAALYRPIDPKTKKLVKKPIEVELTAVDKKTQTANLKQLDNPKVTYKAIKLDLLEPIS